MTGRAFVGVDTGAGDDKTVVVVRDGLRILSAILEKFSRRLKPIWLSTRAKTGKHQRCASARGRKKALHAGHMRTNGTIRFRRWGGVVGDARLSGTAMEMLSRLPIVRTMDLNQEGSRQAAYMRLQRGLRGFP